MRSALACRNELFTSHSRYMLDILDSYGDCHETMAYREDKFEIRDANRCKIASHLLMTLFKRCHCIHVPADAQT